MKSKQDITKEVLESIKSILENSDDNDELNPTDSLIESGRLASIDVVTIIADFEEKYDIDFSSNFAVDNFESVETIVDTFFDF